MACCCTPELPKINSKFRTALWIALIINAVMFLVELIGGAYAHSSALWADSLDFFCDAVNYGISLAVLEMSLYWRASVALVKGMTMALFGFIVIGKTSYAYIQGILPEAMTMGLIGVLALTTNVISAAFLYAFRNGDSNMQSVWLCSRNDAIGNVAVILAAVGVFGTGSLWPDIVVAVIMSLLGLTAGYRVIQRALQERKENKPFTHVHE